MNAHVRRVLAVLEVTVVAFGVWPFLALGIYRLFPRLRAGELEAGFAEPVVVQVVAVAVVLLLALVRRKRLAEYGIDFRNPRYHLDVMLTCFIPVALASVPLAMLDYTSWSGALILAAVQIALLFALAWLLRRKPSAEAGVLGALLVLTSGPVRAASSTAGKAVLVFLTYALFIGFGEEILYRGYMQSRLNEVFGRPFRYLGVSFGWGVLITNLLFGLMHVGIQRWILGMPVDVTLAWGFWTVFGGLVLSLVREKTGSILAPALLHGLPQAIASVAFMLLM